MIPEIGESPYVNVVVIGAGIILLLQNDVNDILDIYEKCSQDFGVSIDHVILALDWLFAIGVIFLEKERIYFDIS